ncbi:efflux RND transporter periplasmic adaptor subunit [Brevundimonas sp.]|uniref:efflux RND transporter periplasmic adaptor subunit n=1 Tax=Brevundimonas sp. TaxID=1871086 RepID=UPI00262E0C72|nr:efflux RND transporter periplasmic adaptor subunit [Brevundimonas sp.]
MKIEKHWLMTGGAVVVALAVGFGTAQLMLGRNGAADPQAEEENHEDAAAEAFVALTPTAAAEAGVGIVAVERGGGAGLMLPGRVAFAPGAEAVVDAPLPGVVVRVHVGAGSQVRAGSPLVTLRSPEGAASRATVDAATAAADAARAAVVRDRTLFERGYVAQSRLDITEAEARRTEAELRAARARLSAYGSPEAGGLVVVRSPINGVVTRVATTPGQVLHEEDQEVAAVADLGSVELIFEAPPATARLISVGDKLSGRSADGQEIISTIIALAPPGLSGTVTVRARPAGAIPPAGTVISARLGAGASRNALVVPSEAIQTVEGVQSVFVVDGAGFRARPVVTGQTADGRTEIVNGLRGDERIAGAGAFLLKAELAKGEAEHGH